jgi:hypothetical protein
MYDEMLVYTNVAFKVFEWESDRQRMFILFVSCALAWHVSICIVIACHYWHCSQQPTHH